MYNKTAEIESLIDSLIIDTVIEEIISFSDSKQDFRLAIKILKEKIEDLDSSDYEYNFDT